MKTIKSIKNILIGISVLFLIGCEDTYVEYEQEATLTFDMRLPIRFNFILIDNYI